MSIMLVSSKSLACIFLKALRMIVPCACHELFFNRVSEPTPHFALSKWCLQEESDSSAVARAQDSTKPKLRYRGSEAIPGISTSTISTSL
jgi:hypothetical protein